MKIDKPGIYADIPMEVYLSDPVIAPSLSSSIAITLLQQSPYHAWVRHPRHPEPLPRDESKVANIGTVAHAMLLEKSEDQVCVIDPRDYPAEKTGNIPDGFTNKAIRAARDAARAEGKTPMLLADMERCRAMRDAAERYVRGSEIAGVFEKGESEAVVVTREGPTWLRCRPDWMTHDRSAIVHFKTTARSARPESFIRGLLPNMGYDLSLAFYERVIAEATGVTPKIHCILAQEQEPPYACSLIALSPAYADICSRQIARAVGIWANCMRTNSWPAYPARIAYAEPRPWQLAEAEEDEIRDFMTPADPAQAQHGVQI